MKICHLCKLVSVAEVLDLGMQPISNRFLSDPDEDEYEYPMVIGQCNSCGLVQISDPVSVKEVLPRYDWITYNEPEDHLDTLVEIIAQLPGITLESTFCGVSFKDDSTLSRLERLGFEHTWRIDPKADLEINFSGAGVETVQDRLTPGSAEMIAGKYGAADVVIVRHIIEHAYDTQSFMGAVKRLVKPEGYVVFEVPDCTQALEKKDYTTLWEEHIVYFSPEIFRHCFSFGGFSLDRFECYPYPFENSLVGIAKPGKDISSVFPPENILKSEKARALAYSQELPKQRSLLRRFFSDYRRNMGKIAIFGAGHLACMYINLLDLKEDIEFVVDDNPNKRGLFMPGSRLPVVGSDSLVRENIKLCLLSLSPRGEDKVIRNNQDFLEHGGAFSSIFPASRYALNVSIKA